MARVSNSREARCSAVAVKTTKRRANTRKARRTSPPSDPAGTSRGPALGMVIVDGVPADAYSSVHLLFLPRAATSPQWETAGRLTGCRGRRREGSSLGVDDGRAAAGRGSKGERQAGELSPAPAHRVRLLVAAGGGTCPCRGRRDR